MVSTCLHSARFCYCGAEIFVVALSVVSRGDPNMLEDVSAPNAQDCNELGRFARSCCSKIPGDAASGYSSK